MTTPESVLLQRIYERSAGLGALLGKVLELGPGDDCASLRLGGGSLLATVDQLVEGRHYAPDTPIDLVARKCVARSVSDIAAMGGSPLAALATGALRDSFAHAEELFDAMHRAANDLGCPLVGGDIARLDGPSVLTCTVLGTAHPARGIVTRAGAKPGDGVYLSGMVGGSLRSGRHLTFEPQVKEAARLCDALGPALHAMIDVSDGVGRDAGRVAEASGVRIEVDANALPVHDDAGGWRAGLSDGEDYVLLFTASESPGKSFPRIGTVRDGTGCVVRTPEGGILDAGEFGWDHRGA